MRRRPPLLLALALALGPVLAACSSSEDPAATPTGSATSAPTVDVGSVEDLDLASLAVRRAPFCAALEEEVSAEALRSEVTGTTDYASGDEAAITDGVRDVAHEYDCTVVTDSGLVARAWVFAPPITERWARGLAATTPQGCRADPAAPAYGVPTTAWTCQRRGAEAVRMAGLFGDAWLTCEVSTRGDAADLGELADRWCAVAAEVAAS